MGAAGVTRSKRRPAVLSCGRTSSTQQRAQKTPLCTVPICTARSALEIGWRFASKTIGPGQWMRAQTGVDKYLSPLFGVSARQVE